MESLHEIAVGGGGRLRGARFERADRAARVQAGGDAVPGAEELEPDVVAERIVPCSREDRKRPAAQLEHGGRDVDVVVVGEPRRLAHGAVGVDLDDLLARDEAQRVEVVDVEVAEDAARGRDVGLGGRGGIVRRGARDQQAAERAARRPPRRAAR